MENRFDTSSALSRILFCTDFSQNADFAFFFAVDAAMRRPGCELYLLHVVPESESQFWKTYIYEVEDVDSKARRDIDQRIQQSYLDKLPQGLEAKVEFRVGRDHEEILNFANQMDIDLIVIGRHGHSTLQTALFGNVAEKIVRKADCAVMVIPLSFQKKLQK